MQKAVHQEYAPQQATQRGHSTSFLDTATPEQLDVGRGTREEAGRSATMLNGGMDGHRGGQSHVYLLQAKETLNDCQTSLRQGLTM